MGMGCLGLFSRSWWWWTTCKRLVSIRAPTILARVVSTRPVPMRCSMEMPRSFPVIRMNGSYFCSDPHVLPNPLFYKTYETGHIDIHLTNFHFAPFFCFE